MTPTLSFAWLRVRTRSDSADTDLWQYLIMCTGRTTRSLPGRTTAQSAAVFAKGAAAELLGADDWGICDAVAAATRDMVDHSPGPVVEVSVVVHRDSVEVLVAGGGVYARREVLAEGLFQTPVDCDLP